MLGKILLTLAVILGAYAVIRARFRSVDEGARSQPSPAPPPLIPAATVRAAAYGLVAVMVAGSLLWLYLDSVSYTHLTLPTTCNLCRSRWSPDQ